MFLLYLLGFPISFTLIFLGFVFGYLGFGKISFLFNDLAIFNGYDRTNFGRRSTLCFYGYNDGTSWINGKIIFSFPINVS